jgi:hypothetical protein
VRRALVTGHRGFIGRHIHAALDAHGWTVDEVSLYDEEGVEGWRWTAPGGEEHVAIGGWDGPPPFDPDWIPAVAPPGPDPYEGHTPGPWSHGLDTQPPDNGITDSDGRSIAGVTEHGNINTVARTGQYFNYADARLIADAPTLLKFVRAQAAEIAALCDRLVAVERERDRLIERWPTATSAEVWEEETIGSVAQFRDGRWCVTDPGDPGVYATREAAIRNYAGLAGAGEEGRTS